MKNIIFKFNLLLILLVISASEAFAQLPPGFGDTSVDDTTAPAPISGLVVLGVIVGTLIGYKKLKK